MRKPTTPAPRRSKGRGGIKERTTSTGDRRYEACLSLSDPATGKRRMVWKTFTTRADAEAWLEDQRGAIRQGTFSEDHRMTVEGWLTRWLAVKDRELRPTTRRAYRLLARDYLVPKLGTKKLADLKPTHLSSAYAEILDDSAKKAIRGAGPATVHKMNAVLRSALADAMRDGYVSRNVATLVRLPKVPKPQRQWWESSTSGLSWTSPRTTGTTLCG